MKNILFSLLILGAGIPGTSAIASDSVPTESPHAQAIRLVMQTRTEEISRLDNSDDWWHDTKTRTWAASRPFGPGIIDSTHLFSVSYSIDDKVVGTWSVNTRTGQVGGSGESIRLE